ncbi:MAG: hypothetical protein WBC97_11445 [Gemmatimonadales bacterium]
MRYLTCLVIGAAVATAACSVDDLRPTAGILNVVDTVTLGALDGSALTVPSAFSVANNTTVRTDQSSNFDFAYNIVSSQHELIPVQLLNLLTKSTTNPGFIRSTVPFDSIFTAPLNGYILDSAQVVAPGDVFLARSVILCSSTGTASYAKLEIMSIDDSAKTVTFRVLADVNCGYHDLQPGIPNN